MVNIIKHLSTIEAASLLGISRIAVFNRIKKGEIKAKKIGRNFAITETELNKHVPSIPSNKPLNSEQKKLLSLSVDKAVKEYGEALKKLGDE